MDKKISKYLWVGLSIVFILILPLVISKKYIQYRKNIYPYDAKRDYVYLSNNGNSIKTKLIDNELIIPDTIGTDYTVFLKVKISATFWGNYSTPSIEIKSRNSTIVEYFEDGVNGYRYLNIGALLKGKKRTITLFPKKIKPINEKVELLFYKNTNVDKSKILVIGTHPDDAEIAAYGLYSKNPNAFILNIKSGESGEFKYNEVYKDSIKHYKKKGQLRTWNSITIPLLANIQPDNILNLGYYVELEKLFANNPKEMKSAFAKTDNIETYRKQNISKLKDSLTGKSNWESLVTNLKFLLNYLEPDIIVTPYPALDSHKDHKYTSIALFEALKALKIKDGELFLYSNHYVLNEYFPYGKTGGSYSLPPNFNNDIYFDKVYSHDLDADNQNDKLFALEAMHDLRPDTEWRYGKKALLAGIQTFKSELLGGDNSYFRRGLRSNELFFVIPIKSIYDETTMRKLIYGNNYELSNGALNRKE